MKGRHRLLAALLALPLLALTASSARAVPTPSLVTHGIQHAALFDVAFDGAQGYAVGAAGQIMHTADGGKTWKTQKSPTPLSLLGVATRGGFAVAVGQMGVILVKQAPDKPWQQVPSVTKNRLMRVAIKGNDVMAVGAFGAMLRSTDRGKTWQAVEPDWKSMFAAAQKAGTVGFNFKPKLYVCTYDGQGNLFVAGEIGTIIKSADNGKTWTLVRKGEATDEGISPTIFGLSFNAQGVGVAVGQNGSILRTEDDGQTWSPVDSGKTAILLSVVAEPDNSFLVTGAYAMLWSNDGGKTWKPVGDKTTLIKSSWYSQAALSKKTNGTIVVGEAARILSVKP
ncbi:MAG: YCF48-related protein [Sinobacteraceae bacterium]|nr:YCF48-related protein [Nevskiaceae bacterium]